MPPGGREGIELQGVERDRPQYAVALRGKQRSEDLPQPVIMERGAREAGWEQGEHPTGFQACPHLLEGRMAIENRPEQGLHATASRKDMRGVRRAKGLAERRHVELAAYPQHQRPVSHGTDVMNRHRHEVPLLQVFLEGPS